MSLTRSRCGARCAHTSVITIAAAFISHWTRILLTHDRSSRLAESSRFPKLVGCTIDTNASPDKHFPTWSDCPDGTGHLFARDKSKERRREQVGKSKSRDALSMNGRPRNVVHKFPRNGRTLTFVSFSSRDIHSASPKSASRHFQ